MSKPVINGRSLTKRATSQTFTAAELDKGGQPDTTNIKRQPLDASLSLTLSNESLTSADGQQLLAKPIESSVLNEILAQSSVGLFQQSLTNETTNFYQVNTSSWAFTIVAPNDPIDYKTLNPIVGFLFNRARDLKTLQFLSTWVGTINKGQVPIAYILFLGGEDYPQLGADRNQIGHELGTQNDTIETIETNIKVLQATEGGSAVTDMPAKTPFDWLSALGQAASPANATQGAQKSVTAQLGTATWALSLGLWRNDASQVVQAPWDRLAWAAYGAVERGWVRTIAPAGSAGKKNFEAPGVVLSSWYNIHNVAVRLSFRLSNAAPEGAVGADGEALTALAKALLDAIRGVGNGKPGYGLAGKITIRQATGDVEVGTWELAAFPVLSGQFVEAKGDGGSSEQDGSGSESAEDAAETEGQAAAVGISGQTAEGDGP